MLRRLGIRGKVLAALSVPVLVLVLLAGVISLQSVTQARTARTVTSMLTVLQTSRLAVTALQAERVASVPFSDGNSSLEVRATLESTRTDADNAIAAFRGAADQIDYTTLDPTVQGAVKDVKASLATIDDARGRVDSQSVPSESIVGNFSRVITSTIDFTRAVADHLDDRRLAQIISAHTEVQQAAEGYAEEEVLGAALLPKHDANLVDTKLATVFPISHQTHNDAGDAVRALKLGDGAVVQPLGASWDGVHSFDGYRTLVASGDPTNYDFITAADWSQSAHKEVLAFDEVQGRLRDAAAARANSIASSTMRTSIITIGAAVAATIVSVMTALAIARQIIVPLRRLTEAAGAVRDELPRLVDQVAIPGQGPDLTLTRIPVTSRDEIGQLASAFNEVNTTTIHVAQEQAALRGAIAEMFVNVARRDQVLLNRQLSFIDALERSEEDPKTLADLFRLDHLATRMRRNAESLLVLAGIETGRRLRETLALSDVIRTASSEIEHYERVQLDLPVDPMMLGHTALPAAHMLAELLENATVFSEPGTPVQVTTGTDADNVIITILDQGLGMTPHEFEEANTKIRATSASDVLGSQRLGMFVVGRIAARLGASVELSLGPDGTGTLATIRMPRVLFLDANAIPLVPMAQVHSSVQGFVLPEEAAEVVHDALYAPAPEHVQDVASGALGSAENPAEAVDLEALTDGTTGHGLPRRRSRGADVEAPAPSLSHREQDDAAAAPSIPLAPAPELLAGAAQGGQEAVWQPPVIQQSAPLVTRRPSDAPALPSRETGAAAGGLPTRSPALPTREPSTATGGLPTRPAAPALQKRQPAAPGGLPTRQPAAPAQRQVPAPAPADAEPVNPEGRSAMFSGFRSRRAELAAAAVVESGDGSSAVSAEPAGDGAERLAAAAATASFFGRSAAPQPPAEPVMVVPALVEDDDEPEFLPGVLPAGADESASFEVPVPSRPEVPQAPAWAAAPAPQPAAVVPEPFAEPAAAWSEPVAAPAEPAAAWSEPVAEPAEPAAAEPAAAWSAPVVPGPVAAIGTETGNIRIRRGGRHALPGPEDAEPAPRTGSLPVVPPAPVVPAVIPTWEGQEPVTPAPWAAPVAEPVVPAAASWDAQGAEPWSPTQAPSAPAAWTQTAPEPWTAPEQTPVAEAPAWPTPAPAWAGLEAPVGGAPGAWPLPTDGTAVEPAPLPVDPFAAAAVTAPAPSAAPDFSQLVRGADASPTKKRRWWQRDRKAADEAVVAAPAEAAVPAAPVAAPLPAPLPDETVAPVRQSAWGSADLGAHTSAPAFVPEPADAFPPVVPQTDLSSFAPPVAAPAFDELDGFTPPTPATQAPAAPASASWQAPAVPTASWQGLAESAVAAQSSAPAWAPTPAWSAEPPAVPSAPAAPSAPLVARAPSVPTPHLPVMPQTSFTPQPTSGAFDDEMNNMLAQRADLAQQALAELSQLSSYRPKAVSGGGQSTLVRRTPGSIPAAPAIELPTSGHRTERDANQVRSLLSSFQSGTTRGRQASDAPIASNDAQSSGEDPHAGHEDGPDGVRGEPVTTPDTDLNQRSTSW
ncbi:MAG TPA: nitrate- and nitrite sensing domain-containing protein [Actinotalea sp.]